MKHLLNAVENCKRKTIAFPKRFRTNLNALTLFYAITLCTFLFASCQKQYDEKPNAEAVSASDENSDMESLATNSITAEELKLAHRATERYQDINNAIADGYIDINVVMPNMGYHFQKPSLVDSIFDISQPELLVYNKAQDSSFKLVAVEYAIPLDKSIEAPKGFTGKQDIWDPNADFGLWLLHAWVWKYNPDGVFNPMNPNVHLR
jgi:hypothetical protein